MTQKISLRSKNLDSQVRSSRPKTVDSEAVLQAIVANSASITWRVSGDQDISLSSMVRHLYDQSNSIQSCQIVSHELTPSQLSGCLPGKSAWSWAAELNLKLPNYCVTFDSNYEDPEDSKKKSLKIFFHWKVFFIKFGLVCWVLWHISLCRLFNAKSIFM